jgi:hypothetical protein
MNINSDRLTNEIRHGKKIAANAAGIWGWGSPAGKIRADRRASYFVRLGNITAGKKILEIGCGNRRVFKKDLTYKSGYYQC